MHELSIAMGIVDIAKNEAVKHQISEIELIELEIGTLSGVEIESLNFAWPLAVNGTVLEHAEKKISIIKGKARCLDCGNDYDLKNIFDPCPQCKSHFKDIYHGKELRVKAIVIN